MGHISGVFVDKLAQLLPADAPARRTEVFRALRADPSGEADPTRIIRDRDFFDLFETVVREAEDGRSISIRLGASMRCDDYGAFGLAFKSATDLLGSFQRVERYGRIVTSVANYTVVPGEGSAFMAVNKGDDTRLGKTMVTELAVAAGTAISREVSSRAFEPVAIHFSHERPADISAFEAHFRCPVHFSSHRDGMEISHVMLHASNRLGDARISDFFDTHLDAELEAFLADSALEPTVRAEVARSLSDGAPKLAEVARRLGMSARTLQRRLADEGVAYQHLVEETRLGLAERLLEDTDFGLAEVAFLTGYSEQSTFTRAFKRRNGQTPASYRRARTSA